MVRVSCTLPLLFPLLACGGVIDSPVTDEDDVSCTFGATRCDGAMFQTCQEGVFTDYEMCYETCDEMLGCIGDQPNRCKVNEDIDGTPTCDESAPPDSFEPEVQWSFEGVEGESYSWVTPLVANLTDDNGDGAVDLCDVPDILVVGSAVAGGTSSVGHLVVLDGQSGGLHFRIEDPVDHSVTPAIGDIDDDEVGEIVTFTLDGNLIAFENDGTRKWISDEVWLGKYAAAVALADVDNDGDVEIVAGEKLYDHRGSLLQTFSVSAPEWSSTTAADLDGDGDLEIVLGNAAFHHDGTMVFSAPEVLGGYPQIANLDGDPDPEILVTGRGGISVLEHDGQVKYKDLRPTGAGPGYTTWIRPATIHDFDGDGQSEFAVSSASSYAVYEADASILWEAPVSDPSGIAAGTAFDFLGDGTAEAMYADEESLFVFDDKGDVLLEVPRSSGTLSEYPVVADVDNDGSAEIVVVSNVYLGSLSPMVQVIRDVEDRWIQARRIWNQHTYHVTNVREDGTIPQNERASWHGLNTFRTNAQIEEGGVCDPRIE